MENLIKTIFLQKKYKLYTNGFEFSNNNSFFAASKNPSRKEFFIVNFVENYDGSELSNNYIDLCEKFFVRMKKTRYYEADMNRNTSIIFFIKVDSLAITSDERKLAQKIEEDPYYFKKFVLFYTEKQLIELQKQVVVYTNQSLINTLQEKVNDSDEFSLYKQNPYNDSYYNLLIRLFIKLPFLCYKAPTKQSCLTSVYESINSELEKDMLLDIYNSVELLNGSIDVDTFLDSITIDENTNEKIWKEIQKTSIK